MSRKCTAYDQDVHAAMTIAGIDTSPPGMVNAPMILALCVL